MGITSSDLSVLYEFQWLIGLFRCSISPLEAGETTTGAVVTDSEKDRGSLFFFFWLGKRLCGLLSLHCAFPSFFNKEWRQVGFFMTGHWSAFTHDHYHPWAQNFLGPGTWNQPTLPMGSGLGGRKGSRPHQAQEHWWKQAKTGARGSHSLPRSQGLASVQQA